MHHSLPSLFQLVRPEVLPITGMSMPRGKSIHTQKAKITNTHMRKEKSMSTPIRKNSQLRVIRSKLKLILPIHMMMGLHTRTIDMIRASYLILALGLVVFACTPAAEDHGHSHDEEGGHSHEAGASMDLTLWTDKTELFVEFPALTVGHTSRFAAHFTVLNGHQPVREGSVTVSLVKGGKGIRQTVDAPSSPGIFGPSLQPKEAGVYQLIFDLTTPAYTDRIVVDSVTVYASEQEATEALAGEAEAGGLISFLKEQAWKMEFQTTPVLKKEVFEAIPTSGVWKVAPADYKTLVATTGGMVSFAVNNMTVGSAVKKGQALMSVSSAGLTSGNLATEIRKAKAALEQSQSEFQRKKELFEADVVAKADLEVAQEKYEVAKVTYDGLVSGYGSAGKTIASPIDGFVKSIAVQNGEFVEQGASVLTVTSHQSSLLQVSVGAGFAGKLQNIRDIHYQTAPGVWSSLANTGGRVVSVGREVEADQPLLSVFAEVNDLVEMPEGSFTEASLLVGEGHTATVIPIAALLEDYGAYSVIVQVSGESFERRSVVTGSRNGHEVEILSGLVPGEVIVTKGAYQVKMASMSGQAPAHGHAH
ncbi:efflux RND transporter periplasmic adaptor subunit [Imperialibacter sp.]|uniref:efflux RND transporter periplasmic adaptor subunit n=1 Tax=Imperialibacter sp. TaxID=2038411 RepID=UPI0032EEE643